MIDYDSTRTAPAAPMRRRPARAAAGGWRPSRLAAVVLAGGAYLLAPRSRPGCTAVPRPGRSGRVGRAGRHPGLGRHRRAEGHGGLERLLRPGRGGGPGGDPPAGRRRDQSGAFPRRRAGQAGRPAVHHRPGALRRRGAAGRGAARLRPGPPGAGAKEQQRAQQLVGSGFTPQRDVDQRVNELRAAEANLRAAQAALDTARLNLGYTEVRAPIAGRVGRIEVTAGNLVPAGPSAPVLTTLVSVDPIYASFEADEQSWRGRCADAAGAGHAATWSRSSAGSRCRWARWRAGHAVPGPAAAGRQRGRRPQRHGPGARRVRQRGRRADAGPVRAAALGLAQPEPALAINERAIGTDQDRRFVMVVGADNKVAYRAGVAGRAAWTGCASSPPG